jgi:asparagine synthase (glutamine-hydrolysing)
MCGIAALFGQSLDRQTFGRMLQVASRRGPEGARTLAVQGGMLAHAALRFVAIGRNEQPLVATDGSAIVFNGEIYNWRQLNDICELDASNDTEVLLCGLRSRGVAFLREVDGQFAFVAQLALESGSVRTLIGRDRWGICPLAFGQTPEGWLAIGSTCEVVQAAGVRDVKTVPAGTLAVLRGNALAFETWHRLSRRAITEQRAIDPAEVRSFALERVHSRIPDDPRGLYTTMGGIDSQFVSASVARRVGTAFGGAVTVVPWNRSASSTKPVLDGRGDYPYANATVETLQREGVNLVHHVVVLTPEHVSESLDRLLRLLGPDLFHLLCAFAEDLVAATVSRLGGRAIMTAGGPDEAGRSYDRWTFLHRGLDEELAWHRLAEQFASSEGVRAGLVFGEHGIENRVPLADLIELATGISPEEKQRVHDEGDGLTVASLRMESKIFWRKALAGLLPERSLLARKEPIHGSTGALSALYEVLRRDREFSTHRLAFAWEAWQLGWYGIVFGDLRNPDPTHALSECQLYALYRWSLLAPDLFRCGAEHRYGRFIGYLPRCVDEPIQRVDKPLCYDWQLGCDVPLRAVQ